MPPQTNLSLPFLTRDMLDFGQTAHFELVVNVQSVQTNPVIIRGATRAGPFSFSVTPTSDSAPTNFRLAIPDVPIWISINDAADAYRYGQCFVQVSLAINGDTMFALVSGYPGFTRSISWPQAETPPPQLELGGIFTTVGTNPAAGLEASVSVPAFEIWKIISVFVTLVTDGTATNRTVAIQYLGGGETTAQAISGTAQTASLTRNYTAAPVGPGATLTQGSEILLPTAQGIIVQGGGTITTNTTNLQAGDNYGAMRVQFERFFADV